MARRDPPSLVTLSLLLAACGGSEPGEAGPTSGLDAPDRNVAVTTTPVFAVGGMQAPDWAQFGGVNQVEFDAAGNLYILDRQNSQVTVVGPDGELLRTVGSPGEGPGEIGNPAAMVVEPDGGVALFDFGHQGWVRYDAEGRWVGNLPVDVGDLGIPGGEVAAGPDGSVFAPIAGRIRFGPGEPEADTLPPHRPIVRFTFADSTAGSVFYRAWEMPEPDVEGEERAVGASGGRRMVFSMRPQRAFEPDMNFGVLPDGRLAVADSVAYAVKLIGPDGREVGRLERPIPPTPVTPAIEEAEQERRLAELEESSGGGVGVFGGGNVQVDQGAIREMRENMIASLLYAEEIPVIEDLAVDPAGRIWVQRSSGEPGVDGPTDLITADGRYLGTIPADGLRIPDAFGPDGLVARIELDEFDVATVVVERLPAEIN